jgi:hypothetical protein
MTFYFYAFFLDAFFFYKRTNFSLVFSLYFTFVLLSSIFKEIKNNFSTMALYTGRNELVSYLLFHDKKTFYGFLLHSRNTIITSSLDNTSISPDDYINLWANRFSKEAGELQPTRCVEIRRKVRVIILRGRGIPRRMRSD